MRLNFLLSAGILGAILAVNFSTSIAIANQDVKCNGLDESMRLIADTEPVYLCESIDGDIAIRLQISSVKSEIIFGGIKPLFTIAESINSGEDSGVSFNKYSDNVWRASFVVGSEFREPEGASYYLYLNSGDADSVRDNAEALITCDEARGADIICTAFYPTHYRASNTLPSQAVAVALVSRGSAGKINLLDSINFWHDMAFDIQKQINGM